jgi:hypothetical protein
MSKSKNTIQGLLGSKKTLNSFFLSPAEKNIKQALLNKSSINIFKDRLIFKNKESIQEDLEFLEIVNSKKEQVTLSTKAKAYLEENSIFRKLGQNKLFPIDLNIEITEVFNQDFTIYDGKSICSFITETPITHEVPIHPINFSIKLIKDFNNLEVCGKKVGGYLATYENKIFAKTVELTNVTDWIINKECPVETVYRACHTCISKEGQGVLLFLSSSCYGKESEVLLEELKLSFPKVKCNLTYIPELIMKSNNSYAVVLPNNINIQTYQVGPISVVGLKDYEGVRYLQVNINSGYSIEGLTNSYICRYNNVK